MAVYELAILCRDERRNALLFADLDPVFVLDLAGLAVMFRIATQDARNCRQARINVTNEDVVNDRQYCTRALKMDAERYEVTHVLIANDGSDGATVSCTV